MQEIYAEFVFKMKAIWYIIVVFLLISVKGIAQNDYGELPKTNLNAFQEITFDSFNEIEDVITIIGKDKLYKVSIEDNSEFKEFILGALKQKFYNFKFVYVVSDSADAVLKFSSLYFKTEYSDLKEKKLLGDEYFKRQLTVSYNFLVSGGTEKKIVRTYKDEIKADKLDYVQSGNYAFLKSVLPEKPFLKKIIIPAVIVAVSAIATILFFTIRSK